MAERNVVNGFIAFTLSEETYILFMDLRWFGVLGLVLILTDLRFGVLSAKRRGEEIRLSRAVRRTINKGVDYTCWIMLAGVFGKAFGEMFNIPILAGIVLVVVFGIELNSCFNNYFESKGKPLKVDFLNFITKKYGIDKNELIQEEDDNKERF